MLRTVDTARPATGRVTEPPPNKARSTTVVVAQTAVDATARAIENLKKTICKSPESHRNVARTPNLVPVLTAEKPKEVAL